MKKKLIVFLEWCLDKLRAKDDEPFLSLQTTGVEENGMMGFKLSWNDIGVDNLQKNGFVGQTAQEIVEDFFVQSIFAAHANSILDIGEPNTPAIAATTPQEGTSNQLRRG